MTKAEGSPFRQAPSSWVFTRRFRADAFGWKGSRLAATRLREAVTEIRAVARKDPERGMHGAVMLTERFVPAVCNVDDSWGILGGALVREYERLVSVFSSESIVPAVRLALLRRALEAWLADGYGYLDLIPRMFPAFVADVAEAEVLVPEFMQLAEAYGRESDAIDAQSASPHGWDYAASHARVRRDAYRRMATEIQLRLLDAQTALDAALEHDFHDGGVTLIRALLKHGRVEDARAVVESQRLASGGWNDVDGAWFSLLVEAGEIEHAREAGVAWLAQKATLERFRKVAQALPGVDRASLARDAMAVTPEVEKGRWFATLNHMGLHDDAARLARESVVAPETALRAARKYWETQPELAFESFVAAVAGFVSWGDPGNDHYIGYAVIAPAREFARRVGRDVEMADRLQAIEGLKRYPTSWSAVSGGEA